MHITIQKKGFVFDISASEYDLAIQEKFFVFEKNASEYVALKCLY